MSAQYGRWNFDGRPVEPSHLVRAGKLLVPYGPDAEGAYIKDNVGILFHAFYTTRESRGEAQPHITPSGEVLTWDGRLDNHADLIGQFKHVLTRDSTDVAIVAAAYEEWGNGCLARLIGDWALSIWNPNTRSLFLAKDPIGTRQLYYSFDQHGVAWSTILDPLVLLAGQTFDLDEEYIAGWLAHFPATHLTPYVGIHAVPPSCFAHLEPGKQSVTKYWDFDPGKRIRHHTDGEYEEHFRYIFTEAVRRRLRSDSPVLAELSGGMDSSSIVCMADQILAGGAPETPHLDTISYYNDSEPNWNERPYFAAVEEKRGRHGYHVDASGQKVFSFGINGNRFASSPACAAAPDHVAQQFIACLRSGGHRVVLSGIGGDEVLGGVPTPVPELANLLATHEFELFFRQIIAWALARRKPVWHVLADVIRPFLRAGLSGPKNAPCRWLNARFLERQGEVVREVEPGVKFFGPLPSFQFNLVSLCQLRRQLALNSPLPEMLCDWRYPYLDRDLLEFLFALPPDQLTRPGYRRSLMRRSFAALLPPPILERKRKAYVERAPLLNIMTELPRLLAETNRLLLARLGIVDRDELRAELCRLQSGEGAALVPLVRLFGLEGWIRSLEGWNVLSNSPHQAQRRRQLFFSDESRADAQPWRISQLRKVQRERR
jgi:asparagine synthase (glutamine-hydrolysing)